jgi:hypothetical protein
MLKIFEKVDYEIAVAAWEIECNRYLSGDYRGYNQEELNLVHGQHEAACSAILCFLGWTMEELDAEITRLFEESWKNGSDGEIYLRPPA